MPNYIKNRLVIIGSNKQIKEVFTKYNTYIPAKLALANDGKIICRKKNSEGFSVGWFDAKNGTFYDFDRNYQGGLPEDWYFEINQPMNCFPDFEKIISPPNDAAYNDLPNQEEARLSPNWWNTWNLENWGTKWNISECETEDFGTYTFITAWSGVPELMKKLSMQNQDVEFYYEFADEDTGYNCGSYSLINGEFTKIIEPDSGSKEAYELSFRLRPEYQEDYVLINDKYITKDEIENS